MGPIEILYFTIGLIVTIIGLARGYVKELGSTLIIMVAIFLLTLFQDEINGVITNLGEDFFGITSTQINTWLSLFYTVVFSIIVFMGYAGTTLTFPGVPAPPPQGTLLSLAIGLLNGYLIAGTLWYYQDEFGYPLGQLAGFDGQLTQRAQTLVEYLPPTLFDNPVYWIVPVAVLLIVRVRG
jgi:uncharacterized membrane protein (Fun14 family)